MSHAHSTNRQVLINSIAVVVAVAVIALLGAWLVRYLNPGTVAAPGVYAPPPSGVFREGARPESSSPGALGAAGTRGADAPEGPGAISGAP